MRDFPIIHTWRDCLINFEGETFYDGSDMGAIVIMNEYHFSYLYEYRHKSKTSIYGSAMLSLWTCNRDGELIELWYDFAVDDSLPGDH